MIRWAEDLKKDIQLETWGYFWKNMLKITACIKLRENSVKMIYRWYMTPVKISLMSRGKTSDLCWKCEKEKGTFFYLGWKCKRAKLFWNKIYKEILRFIK